MPLFTALLLGLSAFFICFGCCMVIAIHNPRLRFLPWAGGRLKFLERNMSSAVVVRKLDHHNQNKTRYVFYIRHNQNQAYMWDLDEDGRTRGIIVNCLLWDDHLVESLTGHSEQILVNCQIRPSPLSPAYVVLTERQCRRLENLCAEMYILSKLES